jgi:uncharacterized protein (DUF934 family)
MATLIKIRQVVQDNWQLLEAAADGALPGVPAQGDVIVPLAIWRRLEAGDGPEALADDLAHFDVIAIHFPKFTDGRGYSTARLLRERYGYRGEIRAIGDVQRDQLLHLSRCGFDAFAVKERRDPEALLGAFADFSEAYQASVERPLPLFRRRFANAPDGTDWS